MDKNEGQRPKPQKNQVVKPKLTKSELKKKIGKEDEKQKIIEQLTKAKARTLGQKSADWVTKWVGSWIFIILLFIFMALWVWVNIYMVVFRWDPYPFILFNLILSCIAAIQAPIILMSQNRQTERDRLRAEQDYRVNRKSELEI
jgi:uncharacterized membrane protein